MMSVIQKMFDAWDAKDKSAVASIVHDDYVMTSHAQGPPTGSIIRVPAQINNNSIQMHKVFLKTFFCESHEASTKKSFLRTIEIKAT